MSRAVADVLAGHPAAAPAREIADSLAPAVTAERWLGLDLFRFCAVVLMVEGHVFTTLLDQATKSQAWYPHHAFLHGYTAPMFLLGAGLAFGYTTFRKWDHHGRGTGKAVRKRYMRYFWLLVIGYGLHLPTLSIGSLLSIDDPVRLARMLQVDVLQNIGVSLAFAQLLVFLVSSLCAALVRRVPRLKSVSWLQPERVFVGVMAVLAALCMGSAPWVWGLDVSALPIWMQGYVNASTGSYFPIVPWVGFTYGGIVIAYLVGLNRGTETVSRRAAWPFLALALIFMIVPIVIDRFGPFGWPDHNFWKTNPLFSFWRLGNVLLVLALLCFAERGMRALGWLAEDGSKIARAILPWVKLAAAETLIIYVLHLLVLHGSVLGPGIKHGDTISEHAHGIGVAALVSIALFVAIVIVAKGWQELRKRRSVFVLVQIAMIGVIGLLALTR